MTPGRPLTAGRPPTAGRPLTAGRAPLKLGPIEVDPPVVLAPMAGVTNVAFRRLCRSFGASLNVSEMIMARALVEDSPRTMTMLAFADDEPHRSVQLYGVDPDTIGRAVARLVQEIGVDHIDLNFGCPAAKVTRKGGGAAIPVHRVLFRQIVRAAVRSAGTTPLTVKLRIGIDDRYRTFVDAGRAAEGEGAAAVSLHARTAEQLYAGAADWSAIAELVAAVTTIPVLGNGDSWEAADALRMIDETGCAGVVVGRGCLGRPWLFADLADAFAGRPPRPGPDLGGVTATMKTHARLLGEIMGEEGGCRDFRKHVGWYLAGFPVGADRRRQLALVATLGDLDRQLDELDGSIPFPPGAGRLVRGHSQGPRRVTLPHGWLDDVDSPAPPTGADLLVSGG